MLIDYIPHGAENAITAKELARKAGFATVRDLQSNIHDLRVNGEVICSKTDHPAGYYIPDTKEELERFCKSMNSRSREISLAVKSAKKMIRRIEVEDNKKVVPASAKADTTTEKYKSVQS